MPTPRISTQVKRLIQSAEQAGKKVTALKIDGSVIELVFSEVKEEEGEGLRHEWGAK